jgi:hypothetical protein
MSCDTSDDHAAYSSASSIDPLLAIDALDATPERRP